MAATVTAATVSTILDTSLHFIGVDVGTLSARAAIIDHQGVTKSTASSPITLHNPQVNHYEYSSQDIWHAVCIAVRAAIAQMSSPGFTIGGIGFDATCSLVVLDQDFDPVTVSHTGIADRNVIAWMDHRAVAEASFINDTHDDVLRYVGGTISPEMQIPKLLWLKRYLPSTWSRAAHYMDLTDYLTMKATGSLVRSTCTTTCKWTYLPHMIREGQPPITGWSSSFFTRIGLSDMVTDGYIRIGTQIQSIGEPIANGVTPNAAISLQIPARTPVATGLIDAHAGALGMLGAVLPNAHASLPTRLAVIAGTSTCHMAVTTGGTPASATTPPKQVTGVWGPYSNAIIPNYWLYEGGQSATGKLVDHVINTHAAVSELKEKAKGDGMTMYAWLDRHLQALATTRGVTDITYLTADVHMLPDFHGNRSPRADASLTGIWTGLTLDASIDDLAIRYLACLQAIIYGTHHIIMTLRDGGVPITSLFQTGGFSHSALFLRQTADATGCVVVLPRENDAVLLGAAVTAAVASATYPSISQAMCAMNHVSITVAPCGADTPIARYHARKYRVFQQLHHHSMMYRSIMSGKDDNHDGADDTKHDHKSASSAPTPTPTPVPAPVTVSAAPAVPSPSVSGGVVITPLTASHIRYSS